MDADNTNSLRPETAAARGKTVKHEDATIVESNTVLYTAVATHPTETVHSMTNFAYGCAYYNLKINKLAFINISVWAKNH